MGDWMDVKIDEAMARGASDPTPAVVGARYEAATGKVIVDLENGCAFMFPARRAEGLGDASDEQLAQVEVQGVTGLHWEELDVDLSVPHLLEGLFGTRAFMNRERGRRGGQAHSAAKAAAARANGALGGRPRKFRIDEPHLPAKGGAASKR